MPKAMSNNQLLIRKYIKQQSAALHFKRESDYFEFLASTQALRDYDLSCKQFKGYLQNPV